MCDKNTKFLWGETTTFDMDCFVEDEKENTIITAMGEEIRKEIDNQIIHKMTIETWIDGMFVENTNTDWFVVDQ